MGKYHDGSTVIFGYGCGVRLFWECGQFGKADISCIFSRISFEVSQVKT